MTFLKKTFYLFLERGQGRERTIEVRNIDPLPPAGAGTGWGSTCNPDRYQESNQRPFVCRTRPSQLSHTGQGVADVFNDNRKSILYAVSTHPQKTPRIFKRNGSVYLFMQCILTIKCFKLLNIISPQPQTLWSYSYVKFWFVSRFYITFQINAINSVTDLRVRRLNSSAVCKREMSPHVKTVEPQVTDSSHLCHVKCQS